MSDRLSSLSQIRVHQAMHTGILSTDPDTPLRTVARLMAAQHVHAVAVYDPTRERRPWGVVTALDVAAAAAEGIDEPAGQAVRSELTTISADDSLAWAAMVMAQNGLSHLVVVDPVTGHPSGILSTLDVAAAYGG